MQKERKLPCFIKDIRL